MMTSDKTWVLVAHQADARIFSHNRADSGLILLEDIEHPEGRLHERERRTDRPGRYYSPADQSHHGYSTTVSPDEKDAIDFARLLGEKLNHGRATNRFRNVVLVAGPQFLGLLRGFLDRRTIDCVAECVSKNLAQLNERELAVELGEALLAADRSAALSA